MAIPTSPSDVHTSRQSTPLHDAAQDVDATVTSLLAVVEAMPGRLNPADDDTDDAVVDFAVGLRAIADVLDPA